VTHKFLCSIYERLTDHKVSEEDIYKYFKIIFPSKEYIEHSHKDQVNLGSEMVLRMTFWNNPDFVRQSLYMVEPL